MLFPTYAAGEKDEFGISREDLANKIRANGSVKLVENSEEILEEIKDKKGMYLFMGAGDISKMAHKIAETIGRGK